MAEEKTSSFRSAQCWMQWNASTECNVMLPPGEPGGSVHPGEGFIPSEVHLSVAESAIATREK
jgi:hypothetical protein